MSIEYLVDGRKYLLSYQQLREKHLELCDLSDQEFIGRAAEAAHLACIICYLKEIPTYVCLSDRGIVHELVHLLHIPGDVNLHDLRNEFKEQLRLA